MAHQGLKARLASWLGIPDYLVQVQAAADQAKLAADASRANLLRIERATQALYKAIAMAEKRQASQQQAVWDDDLESLDSMRQR